MTKLKRVFLIFGLAFLVSLVVAATLTVQSVQSSSCVRNAVTPTPSRPITTAAPTPISTEVELRIQAIERRLDDVQTLVEVQSNTHDATVSRMESNLNLLLAILAIASLLAAIMGYGIVRVWVRPLVENRLKQITSHQISSLVDEEVSHLRDEWEPKFTELYEEYHRTVKGSHRER